MSLEGFNEFITGNHKNMGSFKAIKVFEPALSLSSYLQTKINEHFQSFKDVDIVELSSDYVKLEYYPQLYSEGYLEEQLKQLGVSLRENTNKKGFIKRLLDKLAKDNKETFGDKELDCCKLHKGP